MQTQMQKARNNIITKEMETVAKQENLAAEVIRERVAEGTIAICANINHKIRTSGHQIGHQIDGSIDFPESGNDMFSLKIINFKPNKFTA